MEYLEFKQKANTVSYFIGHILFEKEGDAFYIVDGQQRITTTVIVLKILQTLLKKNDDVKLENFSTVSYDQVEFSQYILQDNLLSEVTLKEKINKQETASMRHCLTAYLYFIQKLNKHQDKINDIYELLLCTECTTQVLENKIDAARRFIFENNRGKPVSSLEVFKSLMYQLYIENKIREIEDLKKKFEKINFILERVSHSKIFHYSDDNLLRDTICIYFKNLSVRKSPEELIKKLKENNIVDNISRFTNELIRVAQALKDLIKDGKNETNTELRFTVNALFYLGIEDFFYPFIIKAYLNNVSAEERVKLFQHLEHLIFRKKLISTRADLQQRMNDVFENWDVEKVIQRIVELCDKPEKDWWWAYWNKDKYQDAVKDFTTESHKKSNLLRYIFFKYEYSLWKETKQTTPPIFFDSIECPELEHIAPQTEGKDSESYDKYDEDFKTNYIGALGNFILIPKRDNSGIGNESFPKKCSHYKELLLYHVQEIVAHQGNWDRAAISERTKKLRDFINTLGV